MSAVDLSEFEALGRCHPTACVIARSAACLSKKNRENFEAALTRKTASGDYVISHNSISKWLKGKGLPGRDQAVKDHRDGRCCCA